MGSIKSSSSSTANLKLRSTKIHSARNAVLPHARFWNRIKCIPLAQSIIIYCHIQALKHQWDNTNPRHTRTRQDCNPHPLPTVVDLEHRSRSASRLQGSQFTDNYSLLDFVEQIGLMCIEDDRELVEGAARPSYWGLLTSKIRLASHRRPTSSRAWVNISIASRVRGGDAYDLS